MPAVRPVLIAAGAGYILWLAYHIATAPPLADREDGVAAPGLTGGVLLGVANPKAWIAIAAVFASARLAHDTAADAAAKVAVLAVLIVVINAAWLAAGCSLAPLLSLPAARARQLLPCRRACRRGCAHGRPTVIIG